MVSGMKGCGFRILDIGTCIANSNRWRDSRFHELNSGFKAQAGFRIPEAKNFLDCFGIRITFHALGDFLIELCF